MKTILLLDSLNLISRAFYAIPLQYSKDGTPINAVRGWFNTVWNLQDQVNATQTIACFDGGTPPWRKELIPSYKANRSPKPDELIAQIAIIEEICPLMGINPIKIQDTEADDILGTLATCSEKLGIPSVIASGDKDLVQCVNENTRLLRPPKKLNLPWQTYDVTNAQELMGVKPEQVADFLALTGDSADCLPGVPRVGDKTAAKWLCAHGSLKILFTLDPSELKPPAAAKNLFESQDLAIRNRLATTLESLPITIPEEILEETEKLLVKLEELSLFRVMGSHQKRKEEKEYQEDKRLKEDQTTFDGLIS